MHTCGVCFTQFETEDEYMYHECETGFTPRDPEHLGPEFEAISKAALERGEAKVNQPDGGGNPMPETPEGSQSNGGSDVPVS